MLVFLILNWFVWGVWGFDYSITMPSEKNAFAVAVFIIWVPLFKIVALLAPLCLVLSLIQFYKSRVS